MPWFRYRALTPDGVIEDGRMQGQDEAAIVSTLQAAGYLPIRAHAAKRDWFGALRQLSVKQKTSLKPQQLSAFTHELAVLLNAGLPLDHALHLIGELTTDPNERQVVTQIENALRGGASLSAALSDIPSVFPHFYVALVTAGETGGALAGTLLRLHAYLEHTCTLRQHVHSALIYPALLLSVSLVSILILLVFVIPQFGQLLADGGQPIPTAARAVLFASDLLRDYGWLGAGIIVAAFMLLRQWLSRPERRLELDRQLLQLPVIGELIRRLEVARFTRTLGTLLQNGVTLLAGLNTAADVYSNRVLAATLVQLIESLKQGRGIAMPMLACNQYPRLVVQLVRVGEESGQLDTMLLRTADILDAEANQRIQRLITLLEPLLIVVLGILIAGVLIAILSAILSMNDITL